MAPLLEVKGLRARYGITQVLHGMDFSVEEGSVTTILGANGAGKTTTLRAICGLVKTAGSMRFGTTDIQGRQTEDVVRLGIAHVPDGRGTLTRLTVEENLRVGAYTRKDKVAVREDLARIYEFFPRLKERIRQQAGTLSGGEQQMLAVSRALMLRPRLLLLDEPSFGLAPMVVQDLFRIFRQINEESQVSILLVEQNAALALKFAKFAYLVETGRIVLAGPSDVVAADPSVRKVYLGY
jgi:branched-chain amino acid transport system ATP-binding protein